MENHDPARHQSAQQQPELQQPELYQLEHLRRRLNDREARAASRASYLDRFEQAAYTLDPELVELDAEIAQVLAELTALVGELRHHSPHVISEWAYKHQQAYQAIIDEEQSKPEDDDNTSLETYVATQALADWQRVANGKLVYVRENSYVMAVYHHKITEAFGF
jgi:hypothetical protein